MSRQSDQDRALDRLLRAVPGEPAETTAACVDAERLAAWSEGGLSPAERDSIDAHMASCGRCLAMLAVLSDTAAAPEGHVGAVPAQDVRLTPHWPRGWRPPIRWLVPLTTAAAAVVIWMVLPARPPAPAFSPTTQVARDEAAPAAPSPDAATQPSDSRASDQKREFALSQAPASPPASPTAPPPQAFSKAVEPGAEGEPRRQAKNVQESVRVAEEPAAKPTDSATAERQGAANEAVSDRMAARSTAPPPPAAAPAAALQRADAPTIEIASPDPTYRWRIRGMAVERSTSGGSSWQPAAIPAGATVNGGTAPGPNVCWLIGPAGTVLWTTDGSRFESVNIPGAGALVSVHATDASRATVTAADKQVYVTTDGGRTWTR